MSLLWHPYWNVSLKRNCFLEWAWHEADMCFLPTTLEIQFSEFLTELLELQFLGDKWRSSKTASEEAGRFELRFPASLEVKFHSDWSQKMAGALVKAQSLVSSNSLVVFRYGDWVTDRSSSFSFSLSSAPVESCISVTLKGFETSKPGKEKLRGVWNLQIFTFLWEWRLGIGLHLRVQGFGHEDKTGRRGVTYTCYDF